MAALSSGQNVNDIVNYQQFMFWSTKKILELNKIFLLFNWLFLLPEAKEQVLANLANFAYDPKNMEHLKELQVTDLFLDMLTEENDNFVEFGMGKHHFS